MALDSTLHRVFCQNLKAIRKAKGLTQAEVADRLGMTQAGYSALEKGEYAPTLPKVESAATALGVKYEDLLSSKKLVSAA